MKDFDIVARYEYYDYAGLQYTDEGSYVYYEDYQDLLEGYKELKWRMEQLEK